MKVFFGVLSFLVAAASCTYIPAIGRLASQSGDMSLAKIMLQQQESQAMAVDPIVSTQCFAKYLPQLQIAADKWSTEYSACVTTADTDRSTVVTTMKEQQNEISSAATGVTASISNCQAIDDSLEFFNCFTNLGKGVLSSIYTMSNNASDDAASMQQQLEVIDATMYQCTNATERVYVQSSANIYDEINSCLEHGLPSAGSTAAPEAPTNAPVTDKTTVAPAASASTQAPAESASSVPTEPKTTLAPAEPAAPTT